jgi:hypothetical protein
MSTAELAIALALSWGAGIRLYAVLFLCGLAHKMGWVVLPGEIALLAHPLVLGASGFMTLAEFLADKVPWIDSLWDAVHTFIRIPAGAALAAIVFADAGSAYPVAAAILGGSVAAAAHFTKAGARGLINLSPEPLSNWGASLGEDAAVPAGLWLAVVQPWLFLALLAAGAVVAILFVGWIASGLSAVLRKYRIP